jgi:poly(A) polymerase
MSSVPARLAPYLADGSPTRRVADALAGGGYSCYLVGGSLRDAFLDRPITDVDLATDARPDAILAAVEPLADAVWRQGEKFGTIGALVGGERFEVTTFRADVYASESRKPEVAFGDRIEGDLERRDFTVNAMALEVSQPRLVDPFDGIADLAARRLRTPRTPEMSFSEDPLRMLRAARFVATLGLVPDAALVEAVHAMRDRLEIISAERIRDELSKLLLARDPSAGLWMLSQTRLADEFLPELNAMQLEQDPIHRHKDVLAHTIAVVANTTVPAATAFGDPTDSLLRLRLGALLHDVGKPKTRGFGPGGVTFHHHEVVGARMARERLHTLRYPTAVVDDVVQLVYLHLRFHTYRMGWTDSAVRRYVRDAGPLLPELNMLTRSDCTTRNKRKAESLARRMDDLEARIAELAEREELARIRPALDGNRVMELLGVRPGPVVGEALGFLLDLRLDEGLTDEAEAERRLRDWAEARGLPAASP